MRLATYYQVWVKPTPRAPLRPVSTPNDPPLIGGRTTSLLRVSCALGEGRALGRRLPPRSPHLPLLLGETLFTSPSSAVAVYRRAWTSVVPVPHGPGHGPKMDGSFSLPRHACRSLSLYGAPGAIIRLLIHGSMHTPANEIYHRKELENGESNNAQTETAYAFQQQTILYDDCTGTDRLIWAACASVFLCAVLLMSDLSVSPVDPGLYAQVYRICE